MLSRRHFLQSSLGVAALRTLTPAHRLLATSMTEFDGPPLLPAELAAPIRVLPLPLQSTMVAGLPFAPGWSGDYFPNTEIPFHNGVECTEGAGLPEETDIVIVGGGISGLGTAMVLRDHKPVLLEMRDRFGGVAQGERWSHTPYSLGNAYVITPDPGTFLESFYQELGLDQVVRVDEQDSHIELDGRILDDFFDPQSHPPHERASFNRYRQVVQHMANVEYPDIPLPGGNDDWIVELDRVSFRSDLEQRMGNHEIPDALASAIQAYFYSSFAAGWEEISAAGGWNFVAAEEFGRWVFPGGTAWMVQQMYERLVRDLGQSRLRPGCRATDVRLEGHRHVLVTYLGPDGQCRTIRARRVVMACPKMVAKYILPDLETIDNGKLEAMHQLHYRAYVVINVLLDAKIDLDFYDVFLLRNGHLPMNSDEAGERSAVIDMLSGHFAAGPDTHQSVLTLYWPLPFPFGRFTLITDDAWQNYAEALVPQLVSMLGMLGLAKRDVQQVRMTRWGHAMPITKPGLIADGVIDALRRPVDDRIFFVNQDNWALPAVENCLLDAEIYAPQITAGL